MRALRRQVPRSPENLSARVWQLDGLPLRTATARALLNALPEVPDDESQDTLGAGKTPSLLELDPGWALAIAPAPAHFSPLNVVAAAPGGPL